MKKKVSRWNKNLKKEIQSYPLVYIILSITLVVGFFIRIYRTGKILGFYFDQGRDALAIWDLWHKGDFFLVGPTTGLAGVFRGPFYYYLISPFYLLGGGNPVAPAMFLAFTTILAVIVVYIIGVKVRDRFLGLLAAILVSFSFDIMVASRWLSNPTPMLILSVILVWMMILVTEGKKWAWIVISFVVGLSILHFGSAGEVFYIPALLIFAVWQRKNLPSTREFVLSIAVFSFTALPQVLFDIRNDGILSNNIRKTFAEESSFKGVTHYIFQIRTKLYYDVFTDKVFHQKDLKELVALSVLAFSFILFLPKLVKSNGAKIMMLLLASAIIGLYFYQGNYGNIFGYYLTGYYLVFLMLVAVIVRNMWDILPGKMFVIVFLYIFLAGNFKFTHYIITSGIGGTDQIVLGNQLQALDWVYKDSESRGEFNTDVYVPPVIPYAYEYLFTWYGSTEYGRVPKEDLVPLLYTLYEVDNPHPERLQAWLDRQKDIGIVEEKAVFGGITVERRTRIE